MIEKMRVSAVVTAISTSVRLRSMVDSLHRACPQLPIYVGAQGDLDPPAGDIAARPNVHWISLPYDCGLSRARNLLVSKTRTPFVLLCDDDFIFPPDLALDASLDVFDEYDELGVLGGRFIDVSYDAAGSAISRGEPTSFGYDLIYDREAKALILSPAHGLDAQPDMHERHKPIFCDYVWNFAIIRKRLVFERGVCWDERFTIGGEHADFFLQLKRLGGCRIAYFPEFFAEHHRVGDEAYVRLRARSNPGQLALFEKYGLEYRIRIPDRLFRLEGGRIKGYSFDTWREILGNTPRVFKLVESAILRQPTKSSA